MELAMKVIFEFVGGPRDGELLEGCPEDSDVAQFDIDAATAYFWETLYGEFGSEFFVLSPYAESSRVKHVTSQPHVPEHKYRIANRIDESEDVWTVARYVGPIAHESVPREHKVPWYERLVNLGIKEVLDVHVNFPDLPSVKFND
jgi:hypothetical protein